MTLESGDERPDPTGPGPTSDVRLPSFGPRRLGDRGTGYPTPMLYTIFIILAIIALLLFIFGRRRV